MRRSLNGFPTAVATSLALNEGGKCTQRDGFMTVCTVSPSSGLYRGGGTTYGNVFITPLESSEVSSELLGHEDWHPTQWAVLGPVMPIAYGLAAAYSQIITGSDSGCGNFFEWQAGFEAGNYAC
jgi:hypothetical protein